MLTHGNMASNIECSLLGFDMRPGLTSISFLPLSHVTARHVDFAMLYHGVTLAYCPFMEHLPETLLEVRPTVCVAVPRVYEKILRQDRNVSPRLPQARYLPLGAFRRPRATSRQFSPEKLRPRPVGSLPTNWSSRKSAPVWAAMSRLSSPAARPWAVNSPNGMPPSASAFMKATA